MFDFLPDFLKNRETAELLFWWAGVVLPIITIGAIIFAALQVKYARAQLMETKRFSEITAQQAQATLLLNLVDKWTSSLMQESKLAFAEILKKAKSDIDRDFPGKSDKEKGIELKQHFRSTLPKLKDSDNQKFTSMMRMLSYFETVGHLVQRRYVSLADVDGLFRGPILEVGAVWALHIREVEQTESVPPGFYENALNLISEIEEICPHAW